MESSNHSPLQSLTREQFWQQHIKRWKDSGLSKMRYCQNNELPYHQLIYWCGKSRQPDDARNDATSSFVSVAVPTAETKAAATLSVELPNGISICGVSADTIGLVPQLLRNL